MLETGNMVISKVDKGEEIKKGKTYQVAAIERYPSGAVNRVLLVGKDKKSSLGSGEYTKLSVEEVWRRFLNLEESSRGPKGDRGEPGEGVSQEDFDKLKKDVTQIKRDITNLKKKVD